MLVAASAGAGHGTSHIIAPIMIKTAASTTSSCF